MNDYIIKPSPPLPEKYIPRLTRMLSRSPIARRYIRRLEGEWKRFYVIGYCSVWAETYGWEPIAFDREKATPMQLDAYNEGAHACREEFLREATGQCIDDEGGAQDERS